ncbi:Glycosyltransferase Family 1 protein [Gigaspora rosea]|uniref:UDP-N-acetylglucosamine transferase subunit ALG13 n=1 Tax=Gigaspora rosea TaxID=44941 RepID=A0A397URJ3_9GLOM|nr:Glycosyltransferase Family 1 protein [Gigaspora rosea]CAG8486006.1 15226_t:CDS:2 [Gigaspora rosea]
MDKTVFVTVGSTGFDQVISLLTSSPSLQILKSLGYTKLNIQYGKSRESYNEAMKVSNIPNEIQIIGYDYKTSLDQDMSESDLIISHAGSGSILESLRLNKPLIVVINENLMNNHQAELAVELGNKGYLVYSSTSNLLEILKSKAYENLISFPEPDATIFANILNEEMGV